MLDRAQYLKQFVEETREYLGSFTQIVLQWENQPENSDMVQEVFRIVHTIKGMAATMELREITTLTHHLENLLDGVRQDNIMADGAFFDVLLASIDVLENLLSHVGEKTGQKSDQVSHLITMMEGFLGKSPPSGPIALEGEKRDYELNEYEGRVIHRAKEEGFEVFQIDIWLHPECLLKRARVYIILKNIELLGEIIKTVPTIEDLEEENFADHFTLFLLSRTEKQGIMDIIHGLTDIRDFAVTSFQHPLPTTSTAETKKKEHLKIGGRDGLRLSSQQTVRVGIERLDQLMNLVGELVITKTQLEQLASRQSEAEMEEVLKGLDRISSNLQSVVMRARMVPIAQLFNRFPRMIRDLAKDLDKSLELKISGEDTELDRRVIDELADPLVHIVRNAIDHGLEEAAIRQEAGKSPTGQIHLTAHHEGNSVVIEVRDDGRGISLQKLRQKALERGIISPEEAQEMGEAEILDLVFAPGFSTASRVNTVSGRGVGLDAVRAKIESLNGTIDVDTKLKDGTAFRIKIPLTLAIIQALLVLVGPEVYALPLERVLEIRHTEDVLISSIQGREVVNVRGDILPIIKLKELLGVPKAKLDREDYFTIIVYTGQEQIALIVDGLLGQRDIVIKPLDKPLSNIPALAGATILGDGRVALILDTSRLLTRINKGREVM
ncbi:MAG: chemotaxis protein CheA [Firmicutes bacterium]|nr:chemotaxis protein CheA [Bacillota bacterium]